MHQKPPKLNRCEIESILPNVTILDVSVFLNLEIVRNGGEIAFVEAENTLNRISDPGIRRDISGIVDRIGQDAGLFRLALLIHPEQRVAEHGGGIVHERGRKNECDRLNFKIGIPPIESFAGHRREAGLVKGQLIP